MSAILLTNPFPAPPPSSALQTDATATPAVTPVTAGANTKGTNDGASNSGTGAGGSTPRQGETVALFKQSAAGKWAVPAKPTGGSIVNAQAQAQTGTPPIVFGANLPEVAMPDPLPTSPFLKGAQKSDG